ncbi:MAG: hypothetical protein WCP15_01090 [bacterium]
MRLLIIRSIILVLLLASVVGALLFSGKLRNRAIFSMEYTKLDSHLVLWRAHIWELKAVKSIIFHGVMGLNGQKL